MTKSHEVARAMVDAVNSRAYRAGIAVVAVAVDQDGNVSVLSNALNEEDVPQILGNAIGVTRNPDITTVYPPPVKQ